MFGVSRNPQQRGNTMAERKVFFTADMHFGHENVISFDKRPFETVEEMDEELIRRWNAKVGKDDLVYVLGDMIWKTRNGDAEALIRSLNGQIILIKGTTTAFFTTPKQRVPLPASRIMTIFPSSWKAVQCAELSYVTIIFRFISDIAIKPSISMGILIIPKNMNRKN